MWSKLLDVSPWAFRVPTLCVWRPYNFFQVERACGSGGSKAVRAVADSAFGGHYNAKAMKTVIKLAMSCIKPSGESHPEMSDVVRVLPQAQALELEERKSRFSFL
jgi:hypothetical protein